jgi:hypothetical protein
MNFNRIKNLFQGIFYNGNRTMIRVMKDAGYPMPRIRKALIELNDINIQELGNGKVSMPTIYSTIRGLNQNQQAMELIAGRLGLGVKEIFPDIREERRPSSVN